MTHEFFLSESELNLILELLESEQRELMVEIRHTDSAVFRHGLKDRLATVDGLIHQAKSTRSSQKAVHI